MNKIILSLFSFLILIVVALLVIPSFVDWSEYKDQIITQVKEKTGYELSIDGPLKAGILPTPHVTLNNVGVDSADADLPVSFQGKVTKASVSVALLPLLSGAIEVSDVTLISPEIDVQEIKSTPKKKNEKTESGSSLLPSSAEGKNSQKVSIDNFTLANARISYTPSKGDVVEVKIASLDVSADSLYGPYEMEGAITYNGINVNVKADVGEYSTDKPMSVSLNIGGKEYKANFAGVVDMTKEVKEVQGELNTEISSIHELGQMFGADNIAIADQSFALNGMLNASDKLVKLNNASMKFGRADVAMPLSFDFFPKDMKGAISLQNIPGEGSIVLDVDTKESVRISGDINFQSLKTIAVDWLGAVEANVFDNPQIPQSLDGDISVTMGNAITLSSKNMLVGDYKLGNTKITYKAGEPATIDASIGNFEGGVIKVSGATDIVKGLNVSVAHPNAAKLIQAFQKDFVASPLTSQKLSFNGKILSGDSEVRVEAMKASIGDLSMRGGLSMDTASTIPSIVANLDFDTLDTKAILVGDKSKPSTKSNSQSSSAKSSKKSSSQAPWTRDAIDTSFMRAINLDLTAKAKTLIHDAWVIKSAEIDVDLKDGVLNIEKIHGDLLSGSVDITGKAEAKETGKPLSVSSKIKADNINLGAFVRTAMGQSKDRVIGTGSFDIDLSAQGLSSSALIYGLNADGAIKTNDLIVKGIDLAKVTEAISDESLTDLAAVVQGAFRNGQTQFQPIDHKFKIREGTMPVENFELVSDTAKLISNGEVSFSRWLMDVKNTVDFTNPDDLPSVEMTIKGPLNAPQQDVANDVLVSFIKNKYGAKIQKKIDKVLGDKLKGTGADKLINNLLGLPQKQEEAKPQVSNDNEQPAQQPKLEEQLIRGLFDKLGQ